MRPPGPSKLVQPFQRKSFQNVPATSTCDLSALAWRICSIFNIPFSTFSPLFLLRSILCLPVLLSWGAVTFLFYGRAPDLFALRPPYAVFFDSHKIRTIFPFSEVKGVTPFCSPPVSLYCPPKKPPFFSLNKSPAACPRQNHDSGRIYFPIPPPRDVSVSALAFFIYKRYPPRVILIICSSFSVSSLLERLVFPRISHLTLIPHLSK